MRKLGEFSVSSSSSSNKQKHERQHIAYLYIQIHVYILLPFQPRRRRRRLLSGFSTSSSSRLPDYYCCCCCCFLLLATILWLVVAGPIEERRRRRAASSSSPGRASCIFIGSLWTKSAFAPRDEKYETALGRYIACFLPPSSGGPARAFSKYGRKQVWMLFKVRWWYDVGQYKEIKKRNPAHCFQTEKTPKSGSLKNFFLEYEEVKIKHCTHIDFS